MTARDRIKTALREAGYVTTPPLHVPKKVADHIMQIAEQYKDDALRIRREARHSGQASTTAACRPAQSAQACRVRTQSAKASPTEPGS